MKIQRCNRMLSLEVSSTRSFPLKAVFVYAHVYTAYDEYLILCQGSETIV